MKYLLFASIVLISFTSCKTVSTYNTNIYIGNTQSKEDTPSNKKWQEYKRAQYNNAPVKAKTVEQMKAETNRPVLDSTSFAQPRVR